MWRWLQSQHRGLIQAHGESFSYGGSIGNASVTGYCIKFRHLAGINVDVLQAAIHYGMSVHQAG
jgi:hypothetical protein